LSAQVARRPEKRQIRRDFANSLLNPCSQGIAVGHTEQISEIFTASVEHRATANAKPINQVSAMSIAELFAYGKANPGKLSYSTPGAGTRQGGEHPARLRRAALKHDPERLQTFRTRSCARFEPAAI
jgi:hypothetical protein